MPPNMQEIKNINIYLMFLYILHDSNIDMERPPCIDHVPNEKNMQNPPSFPEGRKPWKWLSGRLAYLTTEEDQTLMLSAIQKEIQNIQKLGFAGDLEVS